jgi:hypothetical protein
MIGGDEMTEHRRRAPVVGLLAAAAATLAIAVPSMAGASFTTHFSVIKETVRFHQDGDTFRFKEVLLNPANPNNQVGWDKGRCHGERGEKLRCAILTHLDGSIGGFGNLLLRGNIGRGDATLNVVDGTGDFSGAVSGKVVNDALNRRVSLVSFSLTR